MINDVRVILNAGTKVGAYDNGFDAGLNGADTVNCHPTWFVTKELTKEWERGNREGKINKGKAIKIANKLKKKVK